MSGATFQITSRVFANEDRCLGLSKESKSKAINFREAVLHYYSPVSRQTLEQKFYDLFFDWQSETRHISSTSAIAMNLSYQSIIGLGKEVVPLLLQQLEKEPDQLFWALKAITGEDPVLPSQRGKIKEMAQAWLKWASENGYKW